MIQCGVCRSGFKLCGAHGGYLECGGYRTGRCRMQTRLRRDLAERLILELIGARVLQNPVWHQAVLDTARTVWEQGQAACPDETQQVDLALTLIDQKIARLLDTIEVGETGPEVRDRLATRRRERDELVRRRDSFHREEERGWTPPTAEWVTDRVALLKPSDLTGSREGPIRRISRHSETSNQMVSTEQDRIRRLREVLTSQTPAAGVALRKLVGTVVVVEADSEGRKRKHLRGTFTLRIAAVLESGEGAARAAEIQTGGETVTLDFTDPSPWAAVADAVKELYDAGMRYADIATQLRCPRSWPAKALAHWHGDRGSEPPDGRTTRDRLIEGPAVAELADRAKVLWDQVRFPKVGGDEVNGVDSDQGVHRWPVPERRTRPSSSSRP